MRNPKHAPLGIAAAALLTAHLLAPAGALGAPAKEKRPSLPAEGKMTFDRPRGPTAAPQVRGAALKLSIREAVSLALARNFDITIEAFNPRVREGEILRQKSAFDLAITSEAKASKSKSDTVSSLFSGGRQNIASQSEVNFGVEQKLVTGAEYSLLFRGIRSNSNSRFRAFEPDIDTRLIFSVSQPLLKNFGIDVNKAGIRIAMNNRDQSLQDYRSRVIEVVNSVEQTYWDLVFAKADLTFRKKSLNLAKDLRRRNRIRVEVGTLAPIEILEAEATVASREEEVIVADRQVKDREDALKKLLNVTDDISSWGLGIIPSDKPTFKPVQVEEMAITLKALRNRADLKSARLEVDKQKIRLKRARRNLLPQLDLEGSAASLAVDNNATNSLNRLSGSKSYSISGGITFRIPLGNRDAKANLANVKLQTQQALVRYNKTEQDIMEQIRRAVRRVRSDQKRIEATRIARRLTEERLDAQEKKFKVGLSTSRDILEDQEKLANALSNETRALVDYNKSQANLDLVTHSTLKRFRITLSDPRKGPQKGAQ